MKKPKLVMVEWVDTTTYSQWDRGIKGEECSSCVSVGWLLKKDKEEVVLASMLGIENTPTNRDTNLRAHIPRGCVKSIRRVE